MIEQVYAAPGLSTKVSSQLSGFSDLSSIFGWVINLILGVGYALVFVMLAMGFVQYIMSKGEKNAVQAAQQWLTYAVIGGIGLFFVTVVKSLMTSLTGGNIQQNGITNFI